MTNPATQEQPVLEATGIRKRYGHVEALRGADFDVRAGEVVALIGDNGAGKSTLVKVLTGVIKPDQGEIRVRGEKVTIDSPTTAKALGVDVVFQDLALAPDLNPVDNFFLGREMTKPGPLGWFGFLDRKRMKPIAQRSFENYGLTMAHPDAPVAGMSGGQRQSVAVIRAVSTDSSVVLMDEPTAALGVEQTQKVLDLIRRVSAEGVAVILISHDMPHVLEVADRIQVLRLGARVATFTREEATLEKLVDTMAGVRS